MTDAQLLASYVTGDQSAFDQLVGRYHAALVRHAAGLSEMHAEDVVQDAWLRVWRKAGTYDPARASVKNWLYRIVHNAAVDRLRYESRRETVTLGDVEPRGGAAPLNWRQVRERLDQLPEVQREAVDLVGLDGLTSREAGSLLGVSHVTVCRRVQAGVEALLRF